MRIEEAAGLLWYVDDGTDDGLGPEHEAGIEKLVLDLLPHGRIRRYPDDGGLLLDVGAHVGHYTLRAAAAGHRVVAVEANPDTAGRLLANVTLNNLNSRVRIIPHPAWDKHESLTWRAHNTVGRNGSGQVHADETGHLWPVVLDDVLGKETVDVVKLDTEGAELHVLEGLRATLRRCRPILWIEDHVFTGRYTARGLTGMLDELGYSQEHGGETQGLTYWLCRPR